MCTDARAAFETQLALFIINMLEGSKYKTNATFMLGVYGYILIPYFLIDYPKFWIIGLLSWPS